MIDFGKTKIVKVISGGQTGADIAGLKAAYSLNIKTGGLAPKYFKTENGTNLDLKNIYKLKEDKTTSYKNRTEENVKKF